MYDLTDFGYFDPTPWNTPFYDRVRQLRHAVKEGKHISVLLYQAPDTSTFRYRAYNVTQILQDSDSKWRAVYFFYDELALLDDYLEHISLVTIIRVCWTVQLGQLIEKLKWHGITVVFDVDDLVFDIDRIPLITSTLNVSLDQRGYEYWFSYVGRLSLTASLADGFTTTNPFLARLLEEKFQKKAKIIPNFLNREQLQTSETLCRKKASSSNKQPFTLGYFSGTPSHINDFRTIYGELIRLMTDFPDICLRVTGYMEFPCEMHPLIDAGRVIFTPLVDFLALQRLTAEVDVNIAPLVVNTFTNCKSELKFFEAAIVDTLTVAAPVYTFKDCIRHTQNGYLCREGQWYETLADVYQNFVAQQAVTAQAKKDVLNRYAGNAVVSQIEAAYDNLLRRG